MKNSYIEIVKGVMLGHAVADALGVPVEFCKREELAKDPVVDMRGFGTYPLPAGCWSDDTSMALATLDSLAGGSVDLTDIMTKFSAWCYENDYTPTGKTFDIGGTCARAIDNFFTYKKSPESCGPAEEYDNGNGSLMRIHPFSLFAYAKKSTRQAFDSFIDNASALTHGHERSKLACRIYTLLLFHLLDAPEKSTISKALRAAALRYQSSAEISHYARLFSDEFPSLPEEEIQSSGYVVDTLEAAVWCLLQTKSYKECVLRAVNLGSDTDTVAAIAGGLAGALYGYDAIPAKWLSVLKRREYIEELCHRAVASWR